MAVVKRRPRRERCKVTEWRVGQFERWQQGGKTKEVAREPWQEWDES